MKNLFRISLAAMLISLSGCPYGYKYNQGWLPETPVNMQDFNTPYDDYNMTAPIYEKTMPVIFSSNRTSHGGEFDVVFDVFQISFDRDDGSITAGRVADWRIDNYWELAVLQMVPPTINTQYNELGPYLIDYYSLYDEYNIKYERKYLALYASDPAGNLDIMYTLNHDPSFDTSLVFTEPRAVAMLNTEHNEAYPSIDPDSNRIYYCSDVNGDFDIFICQLVDGEDIPEALQFPVLLPGIIRSDILSSDKDDKCPYVYANTIVFTSDRAGGFGGFDLWYSLQDDTGWSAPVNFGEKINTAADEYRPLLIPMNDFRDDLLIFSSNREGGQGGFDLYWVGVDKLIDDPFFKLQ